MANKHQISTVRFIIFKCVERAIAMGIKLKPVYEEPLEDDGWRLLVDGIWPRGLTKAKTAL